MLKDWTSPLLSVALFSLVKLWILSLFYYMAYRSLHLLPFEEFRSDLWLVAGLAAAGWLLRRVPLLPALLGWSALFAMVLDLILQLSIGHRFLVREALALDNGSGIEDFGYLFAVFAVIVFVHYLAGRLLARTPKHAALTLGSGLLAVAVGSAALFPTPADAGTGAENVLMQNLESGFAARSDASPASFYRSLRPVPRAAEHPDIIVVLAESFSASDSHAVSGLSGRLPGFDAAAAKGRLYTNMIADGSSTDMAYVTLLGGMPPYTHSFDSERYRPYINRRMPLPKAFALAGYHTVFEKTYTFDFLHLRDYLATLGFDAAYGMDEHFGADSGYVFDAQPDEVLYDDILARLRLRDKTSPLFLVATTISTHLPYNCPGAKSFEGCYRYAGEQLGRFIDELERMGWFERGILFVVGDHRRMGMIERDEQERYGEAAKGRVAALAVGKGIRAGERDDGIYTQSDLHDTLKRIAGRGSVRADYNDLLSQTHNRAYALHALGSDQSSYLAIEKKGYCRFSLAEPKKCPEAYRKVQEVRAAYQDR